MAIGKMDVMHECFPEHLRMGIARMRYDKDTEEECTKRRANMEESTAGTKNVVPTA